MSASAASNATRLAALGDPVRLRLLTLINDEPTGEVCACDLHPAVARSQPTVSHHLRVLTEAGLLRREQRGKWAWFSIDTEGLAQVIDELSSLQRGPARVV